MRRARLRALSVVAVIALAAGGAACGGGGKTVNVTVREFEVAPAQNSVEAGEVTFKVTNEGPDDTHEFVVIKTDLAPDALPTDENGAVEETGAGIEVVDEIEDIAVGQSPSVTINNLEAGSYVLICNIWDEEEQEAHYSQGMRTAFTVTG
jgi:uncharacterized cupredoxin-like copper-binding protein